MSGPDIRELSHNFYEAMTAAIESAFLRHYTAMPVSVDKDSEDGHKADLKSNVIPKYKDPETGEWKKFEMPLFSELPIHFAQGGDVVSTHPIKKGDEGIVLFMSRPQDTHLQQGGQQEPRDTRTHALSDGRYIPGGRSDPRKLKNVSNESHQIRSVDGKHTVDHHPTKGTEIKSVDPSDKSENPFKDAKKFYSTAIKALEGIGHKAVADGVEHMMGVTHDGGPQMAAKNGAHSFGLNPSAGAALKTAAKFAIDAASGTDVKGGMDVAGGLKADSLSVPGGIGGAGGNAPLGSGAAATNVGDLGGDLDGQLPNPSVVGCHNIANAHTLVNAANDGAAAAAGVTVGSLYRNGSVLMVRVT